MFIMDLLFVVIISVLLIGVFSRSYRHRESGMGLLTFFVVMMIATWAGGTWMEPIGRPVYGVYWISYFIVGIFVALLMTVVLSHHERENKRRFDIHNKEKKRKAFHNQDDQEQVEVEATIDLFLFGFILLALGAIIMSYV